MRKPERGRDVGVKARRSVTICSPWLVSLPVDQSQPELKPLIFFLSFTLALLRFPIFHPSKPLTAQCLKAALSSDTCALSCNQQGAYVRQTGVEQRGGVR